MSRVMQCIYFFNFNVLSRRNQICKLLWGQSPLGESFVPFLQQAGHLTCPFAISYLLSCPHTHNWILPAWLWTCHPSFWNRRSDQVPLVRSGYFASEEKPLEIFKCRPDAWCPGGRPGLLSFVFVCVLDSVVPDWKGSNSSVSWGLYHVNPKQSVKDDDGCLAMFGWTTISIRFPCKDLESSNWNNHFLTVVWGSRTVYLLPIYSCFGKWPVHRKLHWRFTGTPLCSLPSWAKLGWRAMYWVWRCNCDMGIGHSYLSHSHFNVLLLCEWPSVLAGTEISEL